MTLFSILTAQSFLCQFSLSCEIELITSRASIISSCRQNDLLRALISSMHEKLQFYHHYHLGWGKLHNKCTWAIINDVKSCSLSSPYKKSTFLHSSLRQVKRGFLALKCFLRLYNFLLCLQSCLFRVWTKIAQWVKGWLKRRLSA